MRLSLIPGVVLIFLFTFIAACITIADINDFVRKVDRQWQLEYQKTEDEYRYRVTIERAITEYIDWLRRHPE